MSENVLLLLNPRLEPSAAMLTDYRIEKAWLHDDLAAFGQGAGRDVRAILCTGEAKVPAEVIDAFPNLGLIASVGTGYEGVDVAYAKSKGIIITHGAWLNASEVADHAMGLVIASYRGMLAGHHHIVTGAWERGERLRPYGSLLGKKLGVVGLGNIGKGVARRAEACEMQVSWWGPRDKPDAPWPKAESLLALAKDVDVLVVCAQATAENRHMIDEEVLAALGKRGLLVNVARGAVIDEDAMIAALKAGTLGMAGLDVFVDEPTPGARWADVPNVLVTPHMAGGSADIVLQLIARARENIRRFFAGEPVQNPIPE